MNMIFGSRRRARRSNDEAVYVSERRGVRSLHIGSDVIQSSMRIARPDDLELAYTRGLMAFLLFNPEPRRILMIGLGGGSLAKFIHRHMPQARITAVEINPQVVAVARNCFGLPPEDGRFRIVIGDGADYLDGRRACADVIVIDGYDAQKQAASLVTADFYRACVAALTPDGVATANLWSDDGQPGRCLGRIAETFPGGAVSFKAGRHGNLAVLGFKRQPAAALWQALDERAAQLERMYQLEFPRFVAAMRGRPASAAAGARF
ncbi:MAG TPA: polyamine aminopropyltransferase [Burkholderiales bacterium]|nr:polyamine aminopropyltransferase [Burkholderiales bacterium]